MKTVPLASLIFHPRSVREVASERTEAASIVVNALNGMLVVAALFIPMPSFFTFPLVALLTVLFGPFFGFNISSIYSRVEWRVGRTLGSKASREDLYNLFAWSYLPAALATTFYSLIPGEHPLGRTWKSIHRRSNDMGPQKRQHLLFRHFWRKAHRDCHVNDAGHSFGQPPLQVFRPERSRFGDQPACRFHLFPDIAQQHSPYLPPGEVINDALLIWGLPVGKCL